MNEDADRAERLAPEAALHPKVAGQEPSTEIPAEIIGALPNGRYLVWQKESRILPAKQGETLLFAREQCEALLEATHYYDSRGKERNGDTTIHGG